MIRSLVAVLAGTFTLRFSTGLTGTLLVYYLDDLPRHGGEHVSALAVGAISATYFAAELILSPIFGSLVDRFGTHRILRPGPIMGGVAVILTALTTNLVLLGGTRFLEGAAAAASIPALLGYIALATSHDQWLRGRVVARFEATTLGGLGVGVVAAGFLYQLFGPLAFYLNAAIYGLTWLIFRFGVEEVPDHLAPSDRARQPMWHGYGALLRSPLVWLLAPTWIALNAVLGSWSTQSIFQLVQPDGSTFPDQGMMGGLEPWEVSVAVGVLLLVFFAGLLYWGNRFRRFRRTTIMVVGIGGGLVFLGALFVFNHTVQWAGPLAFVLPVISAGGLFVMAGATPAALGLLADISESFPGQRGAIMGLYSVFLGIGQITGSLVSGAAADWGGIDGILIASSILLLVALIPLQRLRGVEHQLPPLS